MTESNEPSNERAANEGDSAIASESRFEEFFDRLEKSETEQVRQKDRSGLRSESESKPESESETTTTDSGGWRWGLPESTHERDEPSDSATTGPDEESGGETEIESRGEPSQPARSEGDRIWNTTFEKAGAESRAIPEAPSGDPDTENASTPSGTSDNGENEDVAENPSETHEETAGSGSDNRWAKLGANLRADETEPGSPTGRRTAAETSLPDSERRRRTIDDETETMSWETAGDPEITESAADEAAFPTGQRFNELDRITGTESVLALGPTGHSVSEAICSRFLIGDDGTRDVLFVTFETPPNELIELCNRADGWVGGEIGIIEVGRGGRNAATASEITSEMGGGSITIRHVARPGDLSKLGIVITQLLTELDSTSRQTLLCFQTLSALHTQVGTKTLFRFLNTLQGRLRSADAVGYYHMDPELHDEIVIETLRPIFESVVRFSTDGELEVE